MKPLLPLFAGLLLGTTSAPAGEFWLDLAAGEEIEEVKVITDLATAGVVYVGEAHTIARHHALQLQIGRAHV